MFKVGISNGYRRATTLMASLGARQEGVRETGKEGRKKGEKEIREEKGRDEVDNGVSEGKRE